MTETAFCAFTRRISAQIGIKKKGTVYKRKESASNMTFKDRGSAKLVMYSGLREVIRIHMPVLVLVMTKDSLFSS